MATSSHACTTNEGRLWLPVSSLAGCVRAATARRCDDAVLSHDTNCFNHYPALPHCTITWWLAGDGEWCDEGGSEAPSSPRRGLPRITFSGPRKKPVATWCRPPFHCLMLGFVPEGIQRLTGVNPGDWIDRWADARDALPAQWHNFLSEILELADDDLRIARIESLLVPLWRETRSTSDTLRTRVTDWCEHAAMRAATSGTGRSVRQAERRFKQWMGLSQRELRVMGRSERAFFHALALEASAGHIDWADVATAIGYSDQSHMIRETRRITGFAPTTLRERIRTEPSFWLYRLWGAWG